MQPRRAGQESADLLCLSVTEEQGSVVSVAGALVGGRHRHWGVFCMDVSFSKSAVPL